MIRCDQQKRTETELGVYDTKYIIIFRVIDNLTLPTTTFPKVSRIIIYYSETSFCAPPPTIAPVYRLLTILGREVLIEAAIKVST